jgi:hypothetical protein
MEDSRTPVDRALQEAMEYLEDLHITSSEVPRELTIEFWRSLAEQASERAACIQEELDEQGESAPPSEPGSLSSDDAEDDEDDEDVEDEED